MITNVHYPASRCEAVGGFKPAQALDANWPARALFFPPNASVAAFPSRHGARLYIPTAGGIAQRWRASAMYPANSHPARMLRACMRLMGALGLGLQPVCSQGESLLGVFLRYALPTTAAVSVLVRADAIPRTTIEARDGIGRVLGYLKYADRAEAQRRITREHAVLSSELAHEAPRVIKFGPLGDGCGLLMAPLPGRRFWPVLPPPAQLVAFCNAHIVSGPVPLNRHPWVRYMREKTDGESDAVFEELDVPSWPVAVHHGDLIPSNLRIGPGGKLGAFDWECGTCEGFPYLDLIQYVLLILLIIRRRPPSVGARYAAQWLSSKAGLGLSSRSARALTRLAAMDRYVTGREDGELEDFRAQRLWRAVAAGSW